MVMIGNSVLLKLPQKFQAMKQIVRTTWDIVAGHLVALSVHGCRWAAVRWEVTCN